MLGGAVACGPSGAGGEAGAGGASSTPSATTSVRFGEEIELSDGRHVGVSYAAGSGLVEQHRDAGTDEWSKPRVVYRTMADACQSITLEEFDGTVAVIADWGYYCADGEPPEESIAAVGTGDLSRWDAKLTKAFDGWEKATAEGDSRHLRFTNGSTRLRWSRAEGFGQVEETYR
ncbi:hypothetical protein ADK57_10110 [Streptomyces sp. MMG1533]|nr:hypothetical protein ADK57_10110 [Streptomyces sp. MMG1533]